MKVLNELKYTSSHEWVRIEGNTAKIGITDYAQSHLGTLVFVELPEAGDTVGKGSPFAVVESVKAASDVYAPLSGTIKEINESLLDNPELINEQPFESWFVVIELSNSAEIAELIDSVQYEELCRQGE